MAGSNMDNFTGLCATLIQQSILTPVVQYLRTTKKVEVSVEELVEMLGMPVERTAPPPTALSFGGVAPRMVTSSVEKKVKAPAKVTGITCSHILLNGKRKGQTCDKPVKEGNGTMCTNCLKRESNKSATKAKVGGPAAVKAISLMEPVPSASFVEPSEADDVISPISQRSIQANIYDKNPDWLLDPINNFLILNGDEPGVFAKLNSKREEVPLTEAEQAKAASMGLAILDYSTVVKA